MMGKSSRWTRGRVITTAVAVILVIGWYQFGLARNRGLIPRWLENLVFGAWLPVIIIASVPIIRYYERQFFRTVFPGKFRLGDGEVLLFSGFLSSGATLYPKAEDFTPSPPIRTWFRETPPYWGNPFIRVRLTDRRLTIGSAVGYTWRIIPLLSIIRISDVYRGKWSFPRELTVIEYEFQSRREIIAMPRNSKKARGFDVALRAAIGSKGPPSEGVVFPPPTPKVA
jgi:hypothetical protein